jgi:hypothetical protein
MSFSSAKKQYYDNYIQYKLTGQSSYKTAYEAALQSMENTVGALQAQVDSFSIPTEETPVVSFDEAERRKHEAELRASVMPTSSPALPPLNGRYITIGVLAISAMILAAL